MENNVNAQIVTTENNCFTLSSDLKLAFAMATDKSINALHKAALYFNIIAPILSSKAVMR